MEKARLSRLVDRCQRQEDGAFDELLTWLLPQVYRVLLGLTGEPMAAEDLSQDVAERVFVNLHQFEVGTRFLSWAMTITANRYRDWLRRRRTSPATSLGDVVAPLAPEKGTDHEQVTRQLWKAALALENDERTVFFLRHLAEMSFKEIAGHLDKPLGTVLSLQHRALARVARRLGRGERGDG